MHQQGELAGFWNSSRRGGLANRIIIPQVLMNAYNAGFRLALLHKDIGVANPIIRNAGVRVGTSEAASSSLTMALKEVGDVDHTAAVSRWAVQ